MCLQYSPTFVFRSSRADIEIYLPEDGRLKETILSDFYRHVKTWLTAAALDTPVECQGVLQVSSIPYLGSADALISAASQTYIKSTDETYTFQQTELGKSLAVDLARLSTMGSKYGAVFDTLRSLSTCLQTYSWHAILGRMEAGLFYFVRKHIRESAVL